MEEGFDWLHSIQQRYADKIGIKIAKGESNKENELNPEVSSHLKAVDEQARRLGVPVRMRGDNQSQVRQTPLDDPSFRPLLENLLRRIQSVSEKHKLPFGQFVVATLPSGSISALCAKNSWEEKTYILWILIYQYPHFCYPNQFPCAI